VSEPPAPPESAPALAGSAATPPELARCLNESGYTPPTRALEALLMALVDAREDDVKPLERALARAEGSAARSTLGLIPRLEPGARPRLYALLVRLAGEVEEPALYSALVQALDEPIAQSRKLAARGLGKLGDRRAETRLLEALEKSSVVEQKSIVDALGALGGEASAVRLATLESRDADLARRRERAGLLIERRLGRAASGRLVLQAPLPRRWRVALSCRHGLETVLADELRGSWRPVLVGPGRVDVEHAGCLQDLLAARTALDVALVMPLAPGAGAGSEPAQRIADALARPECVAALAAWTEGVPRFRISWTSGGHHRALTWALARALRQRTRDLVNDSHGARWTLRAPPDGRGELHLTPRFDEDPRFAYRRGDVPAASHPTIAAALARLAGVQADEVVWDPFVGSGLELVERARLGPVRELWGSDIDPRALSAARLNLDAAGLAFARLVEGSALTFAPPGPSLIVTNPPMGRRVARDGSLGELLEAFLEHAARVLRPSGRLVWLSPLAERTRGVARRLGLEVATGPNVDIGGFEAEVQICRRVR
jgi:precorrin-6B methylase 2